MELSQQAKQDLENIVQHTNAIINIISSYEPDRQTSLALTKFEEGLMWSQMLALHSKRIIIGAA